jgi:hypothetical protein
MNTSTASAGTPMMARFFIPKGQQLTIAPSLLEPVNFEGVCCPCSRESTRRVHRNTMFGSVWTPNFFIAS